MHFSWDHLEWMGYNLGLLVLAVLIALAAHRIAVAVFRRLARHAKHIPLESFVSYCGPSARWVMLFVAIRIAMDLGTMGPHVEEFLKRLLSIGLIISFTGLLIGTLHAGRIWMLRRYQLTNPDNLHARRVHTQIQLLERVVISLIVLISLGCILMTFDKVRELGVSLLASAGIAGVILGLAAQKMLGSLLAGVQVAFTEPIRIEDVVIVEGEWGVIEEITLTYVVVKIWDLRRLVVPMSYFMEKPFQNWTRTSADLLGTAFFYVDHTVDVEPIRAELKRIVEAAPQWDKKVCGLQVTDIRERTVELRCLVSAENAGKAFDLRCLVREKLLTFLQQTQPHALPKTRNEIDSFPTLPAGASQSP